MRRLPLALVVLAPIAFVPLEPERIRAPTLVICGSEDRLTPLAVSRDLAERIAGARLEVVPGGSHMLPATHGEELARTIAEFVRGDGG